ncbi:DUF5615 family PIN-like protein [Candidatus Poribacteria bacterium]|nr:DUF5615 family PIN-like protein [Candidatus Poribacteria bacterium]
MHLLANENFPGLAITAIRSRGHNVAWIHEDSPGISDHAVLSRATAEERILITFDKDFDELVFRLGLNAPSGIILFRIPPDSPSFVAQTAVTVLESRTDWSGHFSVVEENRVRMTPLISIS